MFRARHCLLLAGAVWAAGTGMVAGAEPAEEPVFDGAQAAREAVKDLQGIVGNPQGLQDNLTRPLVSDDPLIGMDGRTLDVKIACPSSTAYLEVLAQPGASGDLITVGMTQDLNMDGTIDHALTLPFVVSGVCANGVMSCDAGTWNNCEGYAFEADAEGRLAAARGLLADLGGCYCINNSCGNNLAIGNLETVMETLGSAAAGAVMAKRPDSAISDIRTEGPTIRYYGQQYSGCDTGTSDLSHYFHNPAPLKDHGIALAADPDGLYRWVSEAAVGAAGDYTARCQTVRTDGLAEVDVEDIIAYNGGDGSVTPCGEGCIQLILGRVGDNYWRGTCAYFQHQVEFIVRQPEKIQQVVLEKVIWDDWIQVRANDEVAWSGPFPWTGAGAVPGACELNTSWVQQPNADITRYFRNKGVVKFGIRVEVTGGGEGFALARMKVDEQCRVENAVETNCEALERDPQCRLVNERVDGVQTVRNSVATGLAPEARCDRFEGEICSLEQCHDWWKKEREYRCDAGAGPDYSKGLERAGTVAATVSETGFTDRRFDESGVASNEAVHLELPDLNGFDPGSCIQVCKTRKSRIDSEAALAGVVSTRLKSAETFDFIYHPCTADASCPAGEGETILKPCQCLAEFPEAAVMMQSIRLAGQDNVCTADGP